MTIPVRFSKIQAFDNTVFRALPTAQEKQVAK